ncbi:hypothetical protein [Aquidulcibacter sp.]|jgi:hypothetical protein|nr:hypothetical protein [Aquidulcibacter sp.]
MNFAALWFDCQVGRSWIVYSSKAAKYKATSFVVNLNPRPSGMRWVLIG